jgi:hypothetical protein
MATAVKKRKKNPGTPRHRPTKALRIQVQTMAGMGIPQDKICRIIGIGSKNTLEKYYRDELDMGMAQTVSTMMRGWYQDCLNGDWKAKQAWLRIYGPPEFRQDIQRVEVTGPEGAPVEITPVPMTAERVIEVLETLREVLPPGEVEVIDEGDA